MSGEQLGIHNQGNWSPAKNGGGVVSDQPGGTVGGGDDVEYYGGYLIAESMDRSNIPIVAAAPNMLKALLLVREVLRRKAPGRELEAQFEVSAAIAVATTPIASVQSPPVAAEPIADSDEWVIQDRVEPRNGIDQIRWSNFPEGLWVNPVGSWTGGLHGYVDKSDGSVLSVRCDAKHLPPLPVKQSPVDPVAEQECCTEKEKPPAGIMPSELWIEARRDELYAAVFRYREALVAVPAIWLEELAAMEEFIQSESGEFIVRKNDRIGDNG